VTCLDFCEALTARLTQHPTIAPLPTESAPRRVCFSVTFQPTAKFTLRGTPPIIVESRSLCLLVTSCAGSPLLHLLRPNSTPTTLLSPPLPPPRSVSPFVVILSLPLHSFSNLRGSLLPVSRSLLQSIIAVKGLSALRGVDDPFAQSVTTWVRCFHSSSTMFYSC
jgi:hypothetical protein